MAKARVSLLKTGQPLLGIRDFRQAGIGVLPEVEEFPIIVFGFDFLAQLLINLILCRMRNSSVDCTAKNNPPNFKFLFARLNSENLPWEVHVVQQILEARVGLKGLESWIHTDIGHPDSPLPVGLF